MNEEREQIKRYSEEMVEIRLKEMRESNQKYGNACNTVRELSLKANKVLQALSEEQRKILLDYEDSRMIMERAESMGLYCAGIKDGFRLCRYFET